MAALEFSSLWTDILIFSASALTFAERAGDRPLTVHAKIFGGDISGTQQEVLRVLGPRIKALVLRLNYRSQTYTFAHTLEAHSESLSSLSIITDALNTLLIVSPRALLLMDRCPRLTTCTLQVPSADFGDQGYPLLYTSFFPNFPALR
ncbi:hypothetical protein BV20DRAFT_1056390 [Pilatotrama ljubarskyi]|nr:hypothetical protein BV20DRAFT_1056390 [Pilatotrama ljubarskyi]